MEIKRLRLTTFVLSLPCNDGMLVCACPIIPKSILIVPCLMVQSTMSKRTRNRGQTKLGTKPAALNGETQRLGKGNSKKKLLVDIEYT